jgi:hypothetical protein
MPHGERHVNAPHRRARLGPSQVDETPHWNDAWFMQPSRCTHAMEIIRDDAIRTYAVAWAGKSMRRRPPASFTCRVANLQHMTKFTKFVGFRILSENLNL